nr:MAG TPA: hypothetical protein [Caudoviricetes sp.]
MSRDPKGLVQSGAEHQRALQQEPTGEVEKSPDVI